MAAVALTASSAATAQAGAAATPGTVDASPDIGRRLFSTGATPACSICHTLKDAAATGEIGPSLDQLRPDVDRVAKALRHGIGPMPSYRERLTEEQIDALASYVAKAAGAH